MALHVIVGAGPVGQAAAEALVHMGHQVRVVTRSGGHSDAVERVAADAADPRRLTELTIGADALYNCANPKYHEWPAQWPPLASSLLTAATRTGAVLVAMSNLYGYGPVVGPMTEDLPLAATTVKGQIRAKMWRDMLAAHERGEVRVAEARASDFVGRGAMSLFTEMVAGKVLAGRRALAPADFDLPHSLSYPGDAGRTLAALGTDQRAWGRAWHVPTPPPTTLRHAAERLAQLAGAPAPRLATMPDWMLRMGGVFNPIAKEFVEMRYQFVRPFELDSSAAQQTFGLTPTSLDGALKTMI
jgi:nucleoside-diphosphate-sugar epimerase